MNRAMEIITESTHPKLYEPSTRRLFLFVTSIARTNLEAEIIQRGGTLCSKNILRYKPKRECLGKLSTLSSNSQIQIILTFDILFCSATVELIIRVFTFFGAMGTRKVVYVFV